jgi:hypothetical protein
MKMETDSYEENIPFGVIFFFDDFEEAFKVYKKAHTPMSLLSLT